MRRNWKLTVFVRIPLCLILCSIALVTLLRWDQVRYTPVMLKRAFQFRQEKNYRTEQEWVSLDDVSPELIKAVVLAEDQKFYSHHGFDWQELHRMWASDREEGAPIRGCSTISQQTAKNLFTFGTRTWLRKGVEAWWTILIELLWGKDRIMEVYLNVVEMGRGIYGMQAAALEYYSIPAIDLTAKEAASLAVCLPAPLRCSPFRLSIAEQRRRSRILAKMNN